MSHHLCDTYIETNAEKQSTFKSLLARNLVKFLSLCQAFRLYLSCDDFAILIIENSSSKEKNFQAIVEQHWQRVFIILYIY